MPWRNPTNWGILSGEDGEEGEESSVASCWNLTLARDRVDFAKYAIDVFAT